jgi:hypothetical protein
MDDKFAIMHGMENINVSIGAPTASLSLGLNQWCYATANSSGAHFLVPLKNKLTGRSFSNLNFALNPLRM